MSACYESHHVNVPLFVGKQNVLKVSHRLAKQCCRLVYQKQCHILSCLRDNACKMSSATSHKSRASCAVSRPLSVHVLNLDINMTQLINHFVWFICIQLQLYACEQPKAAHVQSTLHFLFTFTQSVSDKVVTDVKIFPVENSNH